MSILSNFRLGIISLFLVGVLSACEPQEAVLGPNASFTPDHARISAASLIPGVEVVGLTETTGGYGYDALSHAFDQWLLGSSFADNILTDPDGTRHATSVQPVPGFMLLSSNFGGESTRSVTIPANHYVFLSILGGTSWVYQNDPCDRRKVPVGHPLTSILKAWTGSSMNKAKDLVATLDGQPIVADVRAYRVRSSTFAVSVHPDFNNPACDYTGQTATAKGDSYALLLKLPAGLHTLRFGGVLPGAFSSYVTWNLTVQ